MKSIECGRIVLTLLLLEASLSIARADGGDIRLRETQGPLIVTIFTTGDLVQNRTADVSILVQRRGSSEAVLDAIVNLVFSAPIPTPSLNARDEPLCGMPESGPFAQASELHTAPFAAPASRKLASNKLLYAAAVKFGVVGNWRLEASIQHGTDVVTVACNLPVSPASPGIVGLIPYMILPLLTVGLFVVNQYLRRYPPINRTSIVPV